MMKVAVVGCTGQLGTDLVKVLTAGGEHSVVPISHEEVDCTDSEATRRALGDAAPDAVVNCAAFVRVDDCEDHPEEALAINVLGSLNVARACAESGTLCVYVSTDYVFDGGKGSAYTERDTPLPINVYGTSKLAGEYMVRQAAKDWLIVRTSSLFGITGARGKGGNFIETILSRARAGQPLNVIDDIRMSPTYTVDAAQALARLISDGTTGVVHVANKGTCSWYELAKAAVERVGIPVDVAPVPASTYPSKAQRPRDSSLASDRLSAGDTPRLWREALEAYLREKGHI